VRALACKNEGYATWAADMETRLSDVTLSARPGGGWGYQGKSQER
jgi:uncharacterized protein YndB with AHSA1/START domain